MIYIGNTYIGQASIGGGGGPEPLIPPTSDRNYLYFQAEEDDCDIWLTTPSIFNVSFQYSTDGTTWNNWNYTGNKTFDKLSMPNRGDYVFIRATDTNTWTSTSSNYMRFYSNSSKFRSGGNIMSLYSSTLATTTVGEYCFYSLFNSCVYLTTAPELPATTLASYCYGSMFYNCTALTAAPEELPATTLVNRCYYQMFYGCTALTTAPELPATTLANYCYDSMFYNCTSLTTAPELPATTLTNYCYSQMFYKCVNLNYIKVGATSWNTSYTNNWVYHVSPNGTFVKPSSTSIPTGFSGIPSNWTVQNI